MKKTSRMVRHLKILAIISLLAIAGAIGSSAAADSIRPETRIALFQELESYIQRNSKNGVFSVFDDKTGMKIDTRLKNLHPFMFKKGDLYMLCADFVGDDGQHVVVDFFIPTDPGEDEVYKVFYHVVGKRSILVRLFERLS